MLSAFLLVASLLFPSPVAAAPRRFGRSSEPLDTSCATLAATVTVTATATVWPMTVGVLWTQPASVSGAIGGQSPQLAASSSGLQLRPSPSLPSASNAAQPQGPRSSRGTLSPAVPTSGTHRNAVYFTNWGIYDGDFQPQELPASQITHVLYSFADIAPDGEVISSDTYADVEKHYPDDLLEPGTNAYGCVKQMFLLKKKHRGMKVLLSIGGWTYSPKFASVAATPAGRQRFASSAVKLVQDWGFDGIDVDWEYPENEQQAADFVLLLKACRQGLDDYATKYAPGYHFLVTVASPAGPSHYNTMDLEGMDPFVDGWHLMAYDYAGGWDTTSGHQANIFANDLNPTATKFNTEEAVQAYLAAGIAGSKIILGLPLYGRAFQSTSGPGATYSGTGSDTGVYLYKDLPRPGATEMLDDDAKASYSFDSATGELVTYDTVAMASTKAQYLMQKGLGGAVFWEASGDKTGEQSLVGTLARHMGGLDYTPNLLSYPASRYENLRAGMPGE